MCMHGMGCHKYNWWPGMAPFSGKDLLACFNPIHDWHLVEQIQQGEEQMSEEIPKPKIKTNTHPQLTSTSIKIRSYSVLDSISTASKPLFAISKHPIFSLFSMFDMTF
mmetsp:Transcript_29856/g.56020  ORF Transcript_29856/g.56020 Transcript_29856/m.56020 type:complete len:108 (+) Transcript_29856:184-507(+)